MSLNRSPSVRNLQCLLSFSILSCNPTATRAMGVTVAPSLLNTVCTGCRKSQERILRSMAAKKARKGGKKNIFRDISLGLGVPLEWSTAVMIPSVAITKKLPGWSMIMAVCSPSLP